MYTEDEFASKVTVEGKLQNTTSDAITASYNHDRYNPVDGELVKAADDLAAFMEAYLALKNGISNPQLQKAVEERNYLIATRRLQAPILASCTKSSSNFYRSAKIVQDMAHLCPNCVNKFSLFKMASIVRYHFCAFFATPLWLWIVYRDSFSSSLSFTAAARSMPRSFARNKRYIAISAISSDTRDRRGWFRRYLPRVPPLATKTTLAARQPRWQSPQPVPSAGETVPILALDEIAAPSSARLQGSSVTLRASLSVS